MQIIHKKQTYFEKKGGERIDKNGNKRFFGQAVEMCIRDRTICPKCGQSVTANSRQQEKTRTAPVVILQKYGRQWVERQFKAVCKWSAEGKEIQLFEQILSLIHI